MQLRLRRHGRASRPVLNIFQVRQKLLLHFHDNDDLPGFRPAVLELGLRRLLNVARNLAGYYSGDWQ